MAQVYKVYARYFTGLLRWYKPPAGTVFNVPLFTGWEAAFLEHIPPGWQRIKFKAMLKFMAWLIPRPKLFKFLEVLPNHAMLYGCTSLRNFCMHACLQAHSVPIIATILYKARGCTPTAGL